MNRNAYHYCKENTPSYQVKTKGIPLGISASFLFPTLFALFLLTTSCIYDNYKTDEKTADGSTQIQLSITTRAIDSDSKNYADGSSWENYIDIAGGDYRIYFFTNDKNDANATSDSGRNTLIAEFHPKDIDTIDGTDYTQYNMSGEVDNEIAAYSDFKVVVLANWGTYPAVSVGTTTIDDLVEGSDTSFSAETFFDGVDATHLIPFYGVREYEGVVWRSGWRTTLSGDLTLLRALAKVEVILNVEESDIEAFDSVSIVRYNTSGYCAPAGVYLKSDYDHNYAWDSDFTSKVHLVGGVNSTATGADGIRTFNHQGTTAADDVWTIYLPEYDNTSNADDYSYIQLSVGDAEYQVYFSNYTDGTTSSSADYDIFRNYLYRFYVTVLSGEGFKVRVNEWEEYFDNDYTFGGE